MTAPQKRNHPAGGFFFCVHFTPQSRLRLDGRSVSGLLLFMSPPQSIAKPSPGWNKVALLTAVRNSPCSCPFSVSLHPPLAALNSEPLRGAIVSMGLRGVQGGLRGEIEIFPGPPCKKGYKEAPFSFVYLNPSVTACAVPAPRPGSLLGATTNQKLFPQVGKVSRLTPPAPPYKSSASCTGFSSGDRLSVPV